jgi:hypothetical protein
MSRVTANCSSLEENMRPDQAHYFTLIPPVTANCSSVEENMRPDQAHYCTLMPRVTVNCSSLEENMRLDQSALFNSHAPGYGSLKFSSGEHEA